MSSAARPFPPQFVFGAATAAFQIEGATHEGGRRDSIWDAFCREPDAVVGGDDGQIACDHYHRMPADVAIMRELGVQSYRFSVSWARVRPDGGAPNPAGLDFYDRLVDELVGAGIRPWLTLYHWDLPQALQDAGGWPARDTALRFVDYALDVHERLGDRVRDFTTLNEPWCASFLSYTAGIHAPGHRSVTEGVLAAHHLLLGHGLAVEALRERDPQLSLGITLNLAPAVPVDETDAADRDAARRIDGQFNRWFLDPLFRAEYPADVREDVRRALPEAIEALDAATLPGDFDAIAAPLDFLGVNYYHGEYVSGRAPATPLPPEQAPTSRPARSPFPSFEGIHWHDRGLPRTDMNWEVQPAGLSDLLERVSAEYAAPAGVPLYVTENGAAFDDRPGDDGFVEDAERRAFLLGHLGAVLDAVEAGVDVRGYFSWSLLDNFEWAWGYAKRFGIVRVDYETQERTPKASALAYRDVIAARALPSPSEYSLGE